MDSHSKKHETRERILKTASRLFFRYGCHATGVNRIIADSDIAKATFYSHFPTKDHLVLAWLEKRASEWTNELLLRVREADSLDKRVIALFSMWRTQVANEGYRGCSFINVAGEFPEEDSPIRKKVREHKEYVRILIDKEILSGFCEHLSIVDRQKLSSGIFCLFDSAIIETQSIMDDWPIQVAESTALFIMNQYLMEESNV